MQVKPVRPKYEDREHLHLCPNVAMKLTPALERRLVAMNDFYENVIMDYWSETLQGERVDSKEAHAIIRSVWNLLND